MELRHFRYFSAVAVFGSFSKAARYLNLTQPALSRQVKDLEEELGVRLLDREKKKKVSLTAAGESFYADVVAIMKHTEKAVRKLRSQRNSELLRVGYVHSLLGANLPKAVERFHREAPSVEVELSDLSPYELARRANEGLLDVVILPRSLEVFFRGFEWTELSRIAVVLVASKRNRLSKLRVVSPNQVANEVLFGLGPNAFPEYEPRLRDILKPFDIIPSLHPQLADDIPALLVQLAARHGASILTEGIKPMLPSSLVMKDFKPALAPLLIAAAVPTLNRNPHADRFVRLLAEQTDKRTARNR